MKMCHFLKSGGGLLMAFLLVLSVSPSGWPHNDPPASEELSDKHGHHDKHGKSGKHHGHQGQDEYDEDVDGDEDEENHAVGRPDGFDPKGEVAERDAARTPSAASSGPRVQSPPSPGSQCKGPGLKNNGGDSICLSCHDGMAKMSSKAVHREHRDMSCCECHGN